jgi:uncharacterized membrane protein YtjA (UPF0391 family)
VGKDSTVWKSGAPKAYKGKESWRVSRTQEVSKTPWFRVYKNLHGKHKEVVMLRWALGFFILALIAAVLGFSGIALAAAGIAKIIFFIFLVLFLVSLVGHLLRRV